MPPKVKHCPCIVLPPIVTNSKKPASSDSEEEKKLGADPPPPLMNIPMSIITLKTVPSGPSLPPLHPQRRSLLWVHSSRASLAISSSPSAMYAHTWLCLMGTLLLFRVSGTPTPLKM